MDRIFDDAKDKNVRATYIYGKASDTKAYSDAKYTVQMKTSELSEIFKKGGVVKIGSKLYTPLSYSETAKVGSVVIVDPKSGEATTAVLTSLTAVADAE